MKPSGISPARMAEALGAYIEWCGGVHDDLCPEDDTCACSVKWINDGVNEAVRFLERASIAGCSCEIDRHDFKCPVHNDYGPSRRGPNGDE